MMSNLVKRLLLPGYDLQKEQAIQEAVAELWRLNAECASLRVKVEAMERQEPAGTLYDDGCFVWRNGRPHESNYAEWKMPLYALPGAKEKRND